MKHIEVVLVDTLDRELGVMEKMDAHRQGKLHRAFSVFIYNDKGEMLLQQRADSKYHSAGLWTNACCSHPYPGEDVMVAAGRRLLEEMGVKADLVFFFSFIYHANLENGLIEHEFDHVLLGMSNHNPIIDPDEVKAYRWMSNDDIIKELDCSPDRFTVWFRIAFPMLLNKKINALSA
jgi:isopentenyl-diphosphate Delta-isomerase